MDVETAVSERSLVEKVVLLGVLAHSDDEPVRPDEVRMVCNSELDAPTGRLSEADVSRAMNALLSAGLLEERRDFDPSPVGKGRPTYGLCVDPEVVFDRLASDDQMEPLVTSVRG